MIFVSNLKYLIKLGLPYTFPAETRYSRFFFVFIYRSICGNLNGTT